MRIAIVNDLFIAVEALRRVINSTGEHDIAWIAMNGAEAVEKCLLNKPDLILMDLIMPVMDGVEATAEIMKKCPCAILVVTATVTGNASKVFDAMGYGALDAVCTPVLNMDGRLSGDGELLKKILVISRLIGKSGTEEEIIETVSTFSPSALPPLVAIGASTGGPKALATVLNGFPKKHRCCVVIVQHVDSQFAGGLVSWLREQTGLEIKLIQNGMKPEGGKVFLAGTNDHLVIRQDLAFYYTPEPKNNPFRPSVNAFFNSLHKYWLRLDCAVLLTGMGNDGAEGLLSLRKGGWHTIAQDEKTSIVYGMPKAAKEINAAAEILPIEKISNSIINFIRKMENYHARN